MPPEVPSLSSSLLPGAAPNQPALIALAEAPLAPALDTLYGSWAVAHLNLARAGLLLRLGGFPHLWKATHPQTGGWKWWRWSNSLMACLCCGHRAVLRGGPADLTL